MAMSVFKRFYQFALDDRDWSELCHTVFFLSASCGICSTSIDDAMWATVWNSSSAKINKHLLHNGSLVFYAKLTEFSPIFRFIITMSACNTLECFSLNNESRASRKSPTIDQSTALLLLKRTLSLLQIHRHFGLFSTKRFFCFFSSSVNPQMWRTRIINTITQSNVHKLIGNLKIANRFFLLSKR